MAEPEITAPGGPLAALLTALALLAGGLAEFIRRKVSKKEPSQLDRIEASLDTLCRLLVVETGDGGKVSKSQRLAEGLAAKLEKLENQIARRSSRSAEQDKLLAELANNVDSLSSAVQSAIDIMERRR